MELGGSINIHISNSYLDYYYPLSEKFLRALDFLSPSENEEKIKQVVPPLTKKKRKPLPLRHVVLRVPRGRSGPAPPRADLTVRSTNGDARSKGRRHGIGSAGPADQ